MPLPILKTSSRLSTEALIRQFYQSEMNLSESLVEPDESEFCRIYCDSTLPESSQANRVIDVVGTNIPQTIRDVESRFSQKGSRCREWLLNPSLPDATRNDYAQALDTAGYVGGSVELLTLTGAASLDRSIDPSLQIIPARASARMVGELFAEISQTAAEVARRLLDDPKFDGLLALRDGKPIGHLAVQSLGQAGRINQLYVTSHCADGLVAETLLQRGLEWCARSMFFDVFVALAADQHAHREMFERFGFRAARSVEVFSRAR